MRPNGADPGQLCRVVSSCVVADPLCVLVENKSINCGGGFFFVVVVVVVWLDLCKRVCYSSAVGSANENQSLSTVTEPEQHQQGKHVIII